jgi:manganese/iron transport system permease protein
VRVELFGVAMGAALLAGAICPLIGCFLLLRRTSFYGIVLPQLAACGIAFGFFALPWWSRNMPLAVDLETALADTHAAANYHLGWSTAFTFGGLVSLLLLGRRDGGAAEIGRVAASFAIAAAATILFAQHSPAGDFYVTTMMQGEILTIGIHEFETLAVTLLLVLLAFLLLHKDFLLVSYDRDTARVLGKKVGALELALTVATGLTISVSVMTVGPVVLFGLLVLPPLAARSLARSMSALYAWSAALGLASAALGIEASFSLDWPLGPSVVAAAAALLAGCWGVGRVRGG